MVNPYPLNANRRKIWNCRKRPFDSDLRLGIVFGSAPANSFCGGLEAQRRIQAFVQQSHRRHQRGHIGGRTVEGPSWIRRGGGAGACGDDLSQRAIHQAGFNEMFLEQGKGFDIAFRLRPLDDEQRTRRCQRRRVKLSGFLRFARIGEIHFDQIKHAGAAFALAAARQRKQFVGVPVAIKLFPAGQGGTS